MQATTVIQSHRSPLPYPWIERCIDSVRAWAASNGYRYHFIGDELFDLLPDVIRDRTVGRPVVASDLARVLVIKEALRQSERVVWLDADFLIFNSKAFVLPDSAYAVGREVWVQQGRQSKLKLYKKVHNAFLMFHRENSFLDFYIDTAQRLLAQNEGNVPPQFIGPKLLTALHNVASLPVMERAGMLSPLVIKDVVNGGGEALTRFIEASPQPIAAANLCISSCERNEVSDEEMEQAIALLANHSFF